MLALHRSGRQGDALRAFGVLRSYLGEELGLEPSAETARLEERIVLDDPELQDVGPVEPTGTPLEAGLSVPGYELRELVGSGGLGNVDRAFQPAVGREVAVKVIRPDLANDPDFIRRFESHAQAVAQLEHPHIVSIFDYWREPGAAYLVTRYFGRGSLLDVIETGATRPVSITLDPTGSRVAVSSLDGGVAIVDLAARDVELVPGAIIASSLGFDGDASVLGISVWGGEARLYDVGSGDVPTLIWDGSGTFGAEPGWYDAESDSLWLPASGKVLEIPLDPARWVAKACELVARDLTQDEWDRYVPGDQPLRAVCG